MLDIVSFSVIVFGVVLTIGAGLVAWYAQSIARDEAKLDAWVNGSNSRRDPRKH